MWVGEAGDSGRNKEPKLSHRRLRGFRGKREGKESRGNRGRNLLAHVGVGGKIGPSIKFVLGHGKSGWISGNRARGIIWM